MECHRRKKLFYIIFLYLFFSFINLSPFILKADAHIFVYHRFGDERYPSTNTSIEELKREFEYFKKNNYKIVSLKKLVKSIKNKKEIPDNWIVLTIDDGYKSFYKNALWLFKKYNYPFTLFVSTKPTEEKWKDFMSWDEIKECEKYGEIALHSHSHPHLTHLSDSKIKKDTKTSITIFEKNLGYMPKYYAYPYGEYDDRVKKIIKSFGFEAICNQNIGAINKDSDIYDLDRIALVGEIKNLNFFLKLKHLNALWIEPKNYPKNGVLNKIKVRIFENVKKAQIYVTDYGWKWVKVNNGLIEENLNYKLKKSRVRVIIKVKNSKINTKILVK
ncbi:polysaccharide deacetylase family protein [Nitrosophilus kaiyonis]|uniref:polysaccharide deacetylase family protein n=1 Tax=Nitrosophilus kaiyonis TaxID=2930200 RepID=UPI00248F81C0|nr:polysaccharide deacetylase family protein [Nitrosophilus kaiyonis]